MTRSRWMRPLRGVRDAAAFGLKEKPGALDQEALRVPPVRDRGSFAAWLTPVLPVGISACFGMLARRPAFMLVRRHECLSVRTVPWTASRVSLA